MRWWRLAWKKPILGNSWHFTWDGIICAHLPQMVIKPPMLTAKNLFDWQLIWYNAFICKLRIYNWRAVMMKNCGDKTPNIWGTRFFGGSFLLLRLPPQSPLFLFGLPFSSHRAVLNLPCVSGLRRVSMYALPPNATTEENTTAMQVEDPLASWWSAGISCYRVLKGEVFKGRG